MKKLLLLAASAMAASQLSAQGVDTLPADEYTEVNGHVSVIADAMYLHKASEDGKYLVSTDPDGNFYFIDREENEIGICDVASSGNFYFIGFGNVFSQDGKMVGGIQDHVPGYFDFNTREWIELEVAEEALVPGKTNSAHAITPDGKYIVGNSARAAFGINAKDVMASPVIWEQQADGTYGMCTTLPYPKKDFSGRLPQYISALAISADGNTVVGQIHDYSGFFTYPIIYRKDANGEWSYETAGVDLLLKNPDVEFPEYPTYEPKQPDALDYFTSMEEYQLYVDAYTAYEDSVNMYYDGEIENWPSYYPLMSDFLSAEEKEQFDQDMAIYKEEYKSYQDSVNTFYDVFYDEITDSSFEFNSMYMSSNGKYFATTFDTVERGETIWDDKTLAYAYLYDINDTSKPMLASACTDALVCNVNDNGYVLYCTPAMSYTRQTYVMKPGSSEGIDLYEYIASLSEEAGEEMAEMLTYAKYPESEDDGASPWSLTYDDDDEEVGDDEPIDTVITGTACSNNNCSFFYGWFLNDGGLADCYSSLVSYYVDLSDVVSIKKVSMGKIASTIVTDLEGRLVSNSADLKSLAKGIYLITTTDVNGNTNTMKVFRN